MYYAAQKDVWLQDWLGSSLLCLSRLRVLLSGVACDDGIENIKRGVRDPIYTFIKNEPHKAAKVAVGRLRLIASVSYLDSLVERVLFAWQNKKEIALWDKLPYKPGMGHHDEGKQELYRYFLKCQSEGSVVTTDISTWDWSVREWLMNAERDYRLATGADQGAWATMVRAYARANNRCIFVSAGGLCFEQVLGGIQKSGSYNTSSGNSHMRYIAAHIAQLRAGIPRTRYNGCQMGDDAVERGHERLLEEYLDMGFTIRGVESRPKGVFSFCSQLYDGDWKGKPENWHKTIFRFLVKDPRDKEYPLWREQLQYELRHLPDLGGVLSRVDQFMLEKTKTL